MKEIKVARQPKTLAVDLDGTLIKNDLLHDSLLFVLIRMPSKLLGVIKGLTKGKLALKSELSRLYIPKFEHVTINPDVLKLVQNARDAGRPTLLVSASHQQLVLELVKSLPVFDEAVGSEEINLSGKNKAEFLASKYGKGGFDYIGNSKSDIPVWESADKALVVSRSKQLLAQAARVNKNASLVPTSFSRFALLKEMRIHQWVKNLLVFVPLLAAFEFLDPNLTLKAFLAFISFSLLASGVYFVNDLTDNNSDREHVKKRLRPIAAGHISIPIAVISACLLLSLGMLVALSVNLTFAALALGYLLLTSAYSFFLKQVAVLDCVILAGLYTLRVIAGGIATGLPLTYWLLAFSSFIFFSLAWMKRYAELGNSAGEGKISGRGYAKSDLSFVFMMGAASAFVSILIFALYIDNIQSTGGYKQPDLAWLALPILTYWLCRIWLIAFRGQMNEDPIVFATKDKVSIICGILLATTLLIAHTGIPITFGL
jgi:4-hydroxybenzoate polyprenyltransferase/phosphoserine phosphatase